MLANTDILLTKPSVVCLLLAPSLVSRARSILPKKKSYVRNNQGFHRLTAPTVRRGTSRGPPRSTPAAGRTLPLARPSGITAPTVRSPIPPVDGTSRRPEARGRPGDARRCSRARLFWGGTGTVTVRGHLLLLDSITMSFSGLHLPKQRRASDSQTWEFQGRHPCAAGI
jgi:hypothetical protein